MDKFMLRNLGRNSDSTARICLSRKRFEQEGTEETEARSGRFNPKPQSAPRSQSRDPP